MKRRGFIQTSLLAAGSLPFLSAAPARNASRRLTILYTNDQHSRIDPFPDNHPKYPGQGGFAARAALIDRIRAEGNEVLLLDAGDVFQGTPYFNYFGGELEFRLMSKMGYDACTLGNHDFDNGVDGFLKQAPHASFAFVNSNYHIDNAAMRARILENTVIRKGKYKIGIYGLGIDFEGLVAAENHRGLSYTDPLAAALRQEEILKKKQGCDLVICLSHLGYSYSDNKISDLTLAKQLNDTDLLIGGHTHSFLTEPVNIVNSAGKNTLVTQAGWAGLILGRIDILFNSKDMGWTAETAMQKISSNAIHG